MKTDARLSAQARAQASTHATARPLAKRGIAFDSTMVQWGVWQTDVWHGVASDTVREARLCLVQNLLQVVVWCGVVWCSA